MYELYPYFTNDGSVGLFSPEADDIYHSTYGALTEAYEKFIIPSNLSEFLKKKKEIKVLDICFGIGYNSKSLLNEIIKIHYNDTIGSDNIKYNDKIGSNNKKCKVFIHAIDTDKNLAYLSPFFTVAKKGIKNNDLTFKQDKISKMLSGKTLPRFELRKEVNILLLEKLYNYIDSDAEQLLFDKKYSKYFDKNIHNLYRHLKLNRCKYTPLKRIIAFLHNIY